MARDELVKGKYCRCPPENFPSAWYKDYISGYMLHEDCDKLNYWEAVRKCFECGFSFFPAVKITEENGLLICELCCD